MTATTDPTIVVAPPLRLSYNALFVPRPRSADQPEKKTFQATLLIPPTVDLKPFVEAVKAAVLKKFGKPVPIPPEKLPIKKAELKVTKDGGPIPGYEKGWHFIASNGNTRKPVIVDRKLVPVTDPELIYSGMWVRAHLNAFAWDHKTGGRGVSFGLNSVQIVRDDERLGGGFGGDPTAGFEALEDVSEGGTTKTSASTDDLWG